MSLGKGLERVWEEHSQEHALPTLKCDADSGRTWRLDTMNKAKLFPSKLLTAADMIMGSALSFKNDWILLTRSSGH